MSLVITLPNDRRLASSEKKSVKSPSEMLRQITSRASRRGKHCALRKVWFAGRKLSHTKVRSPSIQDQNSGPLYMCVSNSGLKLETGMPISKVSPPKQKKVANHTRRQEKQKKTNATGTDCILNRKQKSRSSRDWKQDRDGYNSEHQRRGDEDERRSRAAQRRDERLVRARV